jgi:hypothetical protein
MRLTVVAVAPGPEGRLLPPGPPDNLTPATLAACSCAARRPPVHRRHRSRLTCGAARSIGSPLHVHKDELRIRSRDQELAHIATRLS